ncbi:hypothetical protein [Chryseobacterium bernardetii]|uniref:hypothetical protein n=1 Tax=Chryseobacterium bernardetii TaxID=1241978 RepID=UPI000F4DADF8|nr:hypothetical protein [Chryseobacterium bernardetii]AZB35292.1 hypothetical protein EG351_17895 [Chryseobacterium bernardetii]
MRLKTLLLTLCVAGTATFAQKVKYSKEEKKEMNRYFFNEGFNSATDKKVSTIILKDNTEHQGYSKSWERERGQILSITIEDVDSGKPMKFAAADIAEMYLYATETEKAMKAGKFISNMRNYSTKKYRKSITDDVIPYENQIVSLKNKKEPKAFLMQVINPEFNEFITVYHDPYASETMSTGFTGAPAFGGGVIKSYYVRKGDKVIWLHKDDFEDNYDFLFGDNADFMKKYPKNSVEWNYLSFLIYQYTDMSQR